MGDLCDLSVTPETFDAQKEDREIQDLRAGNAVQRVRGGDQATAVRNHRPAAAGNGSFPDRRSAPVELAAPWGSHEIGTIGTTRSAAPYGGRRSGVVSAAGRGRRSGPAIHSECVRPISCRRFAISRRPSSTLCDTTVITVRRRECTPTRLTVPPGSAERIAGSLDSQPWFNLGRCDRSRGGRSWQVDHQPVDSW